MMNDRDTGEVISEDEAYRICKDIRRENRRKPYRLFSGLWCWGCITFTRDPSERCGAVIECPQVVAYLHKAASRSQPQP